MYKFIYIYCIVFTKSAKVFYAFCVLNWCAFRGHRNLIIVCVCVSLLLKN